MEFGISYEHLIFGQPELVVFFSISVFNPFNFANFDTPGNTLSGILGGGPGSVNGTTAADRNCTAAAFAAGNCTGNRTGVGSGTSVSEPHG